MKIKAERLRRAIWRYKQPLTRVPSISGVAVSDLFLWRNSDEWETFFELTDLVAIFEGVSKRIATFFFFDQAGELFLTREVALKSGGRETFALADYVSGHGDVGAFAVFHEPSPSAVKALGCFLTERGYVGYRHRNASLSSYVHGNLDAIALSPQRQLQLLGGGSIFGREYALQHELRPDTRYELAIANPTDTHRYVVCRLLAASGKILNAESARIAPRGTYVFTTPALTEVARAVMSSRLVMARPLVFRLRGEQADALHG